MAPPVSTAVEAPVAPWDGVGVSIAEVLDRLAEQRRPPDGGAPLNLAGILNLVAYVPGQDDVAPMTALVHGLAGHQPARAVLVVEPEGGEGIDATVSTSCRLSGGQVSVGVELVVLSLHGDRRGGDASAVQPLLRSDLPTVLWWPGAPDDAPDGPLARLAPLAARIITESGCEADGARAVARLAAWVPGVAAAVTDLAWAAITPWRQMIVQMIDAAEIASPDAGPVRAAISHPEAGPTAEALLLAGWLRDLAGERLEVSLNPRAGAMPVLGIDIAMPARDRRIAINRMQERQAAMVCVTEPGRDGRDRALALPAFDRGRLIAGELELQRRDHAFERALPFAAEVA
jgi:glucose-6-phosphate dehydrogenase assembly protein OpcA